MKSTVHISLRQPITDISVTNLHAQKILSLPINKTTAQLDLSHLPAGLYLLWVQTQDGTVRVKIVKD